MSENTMAYERKALEGTPFVIHHSETHGWAMGIAEHKMTGWYETEEKLKKLLKGKKQNGDLDWDMLTGFVLILIDKVLEKKKIDDEIENRNQQKEK